MVNMAGRSNFGGGLLKIQTYEVSELLCLDPKIFAFENENDIRINCMGKCLIPQTIVVPLTQSSSMPLTSPKANGMVSMKRLLGLWNLGYGKRGV